MNKTNNYYIDNNGDMIGYPRYYLEKIEQAAAPFYGKLKMIAMHRNNSSVYFILEDENGKHYYMNDSMFEKYITSHEVVLEENWNFYKQGNAYSIGAN